MNTNSKKLFATSLLAHAMCLTVVLSHMHAKDTIPLLGQTSNVTTLASRDITAKALGDLHHHVDKAGVNNIHSGDASTTAARQRELEPLRIADANLSLIGRFQELLLRFRVVASLYFQYG